MIDTALIDALRDCVTDRNAWQSQVEMWRRQLEGVTDDRERLLLLGRLGEWLRQDRGTVEEAVRLLTEASALAERLDHQQAICISLLRLATALQYANRHEEALAHFHMALAVAHRYRLLRVKDFVLQHMGKCCIEMGRFAEAHRLLRHALRLRQRRRNPNAGHIESTQRALEILMQAERASQPG
jgi:tetratricopeptide (TPR) repeat protein